MRSFLILALVLFLSACGVDSSSSKAHQSSANNPGNGSDGNGSMGSDGNNSGGGSGTVPVEDTSTDAGFSKKDAVFDTNACIANSTFKIIRDSSFDPNAVADKNNGIEIASQYNYSSDLKATEVVLYYPTLSGVLQNVLVHIYEENYRVSFDKAWASSSPATVYVRLPKDTKGNYSCYRYELASLSGGSLKKTKVYR